MSAGNITIRDTQSQKQDVAAHAVVNAALVVVWWATRGLQR
ncbi:hypothetical protein OM292_06290 [Escherichia albertii]|nr:hypothetical protein [Escherichia albertii]MCZ8804832.1 hypothetical protein [Escherichia albertii]MCZ8969283.1 hypothetical protein [Escherichia albertii]MCZ9056591.1 hypothetical protein [Escherichia albertii]OSL32204.1 hypothetical protein EAPG_00853 [Escherichia albertii B156]